jgi:photosystem II stability/assembly factor-like uncharacterized protein
VHEPETASAVELDFGRERTERSLGTIALVIAVGLLGWYLWISFQSRITPLPVEEKMLTRHDELFAVAFADQTHGWAVGKFGLILHTADGGRTWLEQISRTHNALSAVSFPNNQRGFAVGSAGTVVATSDGGRSWKAQKSGVEEQLLSLQALSPDVVYAVGAYGTLISTTDGGATWQKHALSWDNLIPQVVRDVGYMEPNLNSVFFVDQQFGWIVGEFGLILHTSDGGRSWSAQRYGKDLPQLYAIAFLDGRTGWAAGQLGDLVVTSDGGVHWRPIEVDAETDLYAIALKGKQGMIVGDGVALVSNDAGATWSRVRSFPENLWLSGVAIKGNSAVAVGQAGTIRNFE